MRCEAWLCEQSRFIKEALTGAADHLQIGLDSDVWPYEQEIHGSPSGVQGTIVVSGIRGLAEGELAQKVRDTSEKWDSTIASMERLVNV